MILTRSPFYYNVTLTSFITSVEFSLVIGKGSTTTITPLDTYNFTKQRPSTDSTNLWVDISPLIRDFYTYSPIDTSLYATPQTIASDCVLLVSLTANRISSLGTISTPLSQKYIATDGYGYYLEGQNKQETRKILLSHTEYRAYQNGYFIVPLSCNNSDTNPTVNGVSVTLSFTDNSTNYVKYLVIPLGEYTGTVTVVYGGETIYIELIEECKYPVSDVQFINRFGVLESMHFYKAAKESVSVNSSDFKNAYTNGISYDVNRHQIKQYNKTSNRKVKIETGFLTPYYNQTVQELMESENVWVDGKPVNVKTGSLEFKTRVVDKLISYSFDFEYAYDEINNV